MEHPEFEILLEERIALTREILASKNKEYASDSDKLSNFKRAAKMMGCSPEKALIGMWAKHIISLLDIVDKLDQKCGAELGVFPAFEVEEYIGTLEEKIGDAVNYLILLEALIKERAKPFRKLHDE